MQVFISWSSEPTRTIATALRQWLPLVVQSVKPWMSDEEIGSGVRWNDAIAKALDETDFGVVCVTASNQHKPWLMFEAGALAKRLDTARVVPLLVDLPPAEVIGPLASFQSRTLDQDGMRRLVQDINSFSDEPLATDQVDTLFDVLWTRLSDEIERAKAETPSPEAPRRSSEDMLEELVLSVRDLERTKTPETSSVVINTLRGNMFIVRGGSKLPEPDEIIDDTDVIIINQDDSSPDNGSESAE